MRGTLLIVALVCSGCSVTPTSELGELYTQHARCLETDAIGCESIWDEIERRERAVANRERQRECPSGTASVGNVDGPTACVSHNEVRTLLNRMLR